MLHILDTIAWAALLPCFVLQFYYASRGNQKREHLVRGVFWHVLLLAWTFDFINDFDGPVKDRLVDSAGIAFALFFVYLWWKQHNDYWKRFKAKLKEKVQALSSGRLVTVPVNG